MPFDLEEKFVEATEAKLGVRLPENYRRSMLRENGGGVVIDSEDWRLYPILDKSSRKRFARTCNDITSETETMRNWPDWPEGGLAIGANGFGDALLFVRDGQAFEPLVYTWRQETGEIEPVAGDFSEIRQAPSTH